MQLRIGTETFEDDAIRSERINQTLPLALAELEPDSLSAIVTDTSTVVQPLVADGLLLSADGLLAVAKRESVGIDRYGYGEKIYSELGGVTSVFNAEEIIRVASTLYQIEATSDIGLLKNSTFYGDVYEGITLSSLISKIVNGAFTYTVDESIANEPVYGWLPKSTRRDALQHCLFAMGATADKDENGNIVFAPIRSKTPYSLSELYMGGSVNKISPATKVSVTEHEYHRLGSGEEVILFDGEVAAEEIVTPNGMPTVGAIVEFSEPAYDLKVENAEIIEFNANYAVVSQSPSAKLTGKKYSHTMRVLQRPVNNGKKTNEYFSDSCGLVNIMNSENVLDRLASYYGTARQFSESFVLNGQKPGDSVLFKNAFEEDSVGCIEKMDITASGKVKATATITDGFIPTASGNYYSNVMVVTQSGTVTIPAECKGQVRLVIIGGGDGGECGNSGEDGMAGPVYSNASEAAESKVFTGSPGNGGEPGNPGQGGKVFVTTVKTKPGRTFSVVIGKGGKGAKFGETPGKGTPTTFGEFSSESGFHSSSGYAALIGGRVYATPGDKGIAGGRGQEQSVGTLSNQGERPIVSKDGATWQAGAHPGYVIESNTTAIGGTGGGAAVGYNGEDGKSGAVSGSVAVGGIGGNGAVPVKANNGAVPGAGGQAGHGGGGGGGEGGVIGTAHEMQGTLAGKGADGGEGGDGADGVVLIYY